MWISKKITEARGEGAELDLGETTISGGEVAVMTERERRDIEIVTPGGYYWHPKVGDSLFVLKYGEAETAAFGKDAAKCPQKIKSGEVYITSDGGAAVHLRNDGCVNLIGNVLVNGVPLIF